MSEEEMVLKRLKDTLDVLKEKNVITQLDFQIRNMVEDCIKVIEKQQEEIDTYKETENDYEHELARKDEEIEKLKKINNIQVIYGGRRYNTEGIILKNYISKDKIREKIKKYDKWIKDSGEYTESLEAQRYALNELLEE